MSQRKETVSVRELVEALEVSGQTVYRMIWDKELKAKRKGYKYEIPVESLQKWIFRTLGMYGAGRVCEQLKKGEEISLKNIQHLAGVAWSYIERTTALKPEFEMEPHEAVERLHPLLRRLAKRYGGKDYHLRNDLYQEMALGILQCSGRNHINYYAERADSRALNYLRNEIQRGIVYEARLRPDDCVRMVPEEDCEKVVKLFRLARLPLELLDLFGVWLRDEEQERVEEERERVA